MLVEFWDKYNGFIADGSSAATILDKYFELSNKHSRIINKLVNAPVYINLYSDYHKYLMDNYMV